MISIVLGQYNNNQLICKGHVTLGVGGESFRKIKEIPQINAPSFPVSYGDEKAV